MPSEADYHKLLKPPASCRAFLDPIIEKFSELFPEEICNGYWLHSCVYSKKLDITTRRIQLVASKAVYQIRPDMVLPYMVGLTEEVDKALYLRRFGVPIYSLVYVFGRDPSYWYRLYQAISRYSIVGTTVNGVAAILLNLTSDEKDSKRKGVAIFIPITVGCGYFLGVDIVPTAEAAHLVKRYDTFREETQNLKPNYQTETVNTDGRDQTQLDWQ